MAKLELTKIFLHNWHRFRSEVIEVQDGLYLAGHNASGKSTILDALQVIFLADLDLIKFNSSAQERSERTLDGFVRGKIMENRLLRAGGAVGYLAVEFTEHPGGKKLTLGCCIEAAEKYGKQGRRVHFILREALDPSLFLPDGQPLTQLALRKMVRGLPNNTGRYYEHIGEYQEDMLTALGHLNRRFFDLFRRALSFGRIKDVGGFIEQWLLPEHPLDLGNLQRVVIRLGELQEDAKKVQEKLDLLKQIVDKRNLYLQRKALQEQYEILLAQLLYEKALRASLATTQEYEDLLNQIKTKEGEQSNRQNVLSSLREEQKKLQQTLYGLDVVKRQQELRKTISDLEEELQLERARKNRIFAELRQLKEKVGELPDSPLLQTNEAEAVRLFLVANTVPAQSLPENLGQLCAHMSEALSIALRRALERTAAINATVTQLKERAAEINQELRDLQGSTKRRPYLDNIEKLRDALAELIGSRPTILCEQLEIPDERWQTAVEAMLDWRRFLLIVPPSSYEQILLFLEQSRGQRQFQEVSVLDLERAYQQRRPVQAQSLALEVRARDAMLQGYIDSILGNIITCASASEVRRYSRAITADLIYYSEWAVRRLSPERYQPWFVGERAHRSQIEARERAIKEIAERLARLHETLNEAKADEKRLDLKQRVDRLQSDLERPIRDQLLANELAAARSEYDALNLDYANELQKQIDQLEGQIGEDDRALQKLIGDIRVASLQKEQLETDLRVSQDVIRQRANECSEIKSKYGPELLAEADRLFLHQSREPDLTQAIANTDRAQKQYTTQTAKHLSEHHDLALEYNLAHQFAGFPDAPQDKRYVEEYQRLSATELPKYQEHIAQAREEANQELREHVLHLLRERINSAKNELKRINDALRPLQFHGDRYSFHFKVASGAEDYYHLIDDSQVIGTGSLFDSTYYQTHQATFDRFYEEITGQSKDPHRQETQARLADYRTYLEYDIRIERNGEISFLSRIMGEQSGGETQTPFYVAIAASFVQLYRIKVGEHSQPGHHERPTIRLAVFDEAFNQMDQDRIGATLDLFRSYGLQIITATPLERCEYLVPKMCTNLVLTSVGDSVLIEPYRNYAARLQQLEEQNDV